ncbi:hypothetical protein AMK27_38225 [Streptomyces sp. CB02009]|nr:hypothetical protein AMK27_38225 [Streptomyces sp. CB02009]
MYEAGDVRVENRPDPKIAQPADAVVRVVASVCGGDLRPDPASARRGRSERRAICRLVNERSAR